jgi:para-nitrobenzyl esterase
MSDAWLAFARTGRPDTPSLPDWPVYDLAARRTMIFDRDVRVVADPRGNERRIFAQGPYVQPGT